MFRKISVIFAFVFAAFSLIASPAGAAWYVNPDGTGFVGKGDVQLALGLSNAQLQSGTFNFTSESTVVTEVSWVCTNEKNEQAQERARTTTTEITGVVSSTSRVKNQITGFNLSGYSSSTSTSTTEGNALNSCPNGWALTPAGDSEVISNSSVLKVNGCRSSKGISHQRLTPRYDHQRPRGLGPKVFRRLHLAPEPPAGAMGPDTSKAVMRRLEAAPNSDEVDARHAAVLAPKPLYNGQRLSPGILSRARLPLRYTMPDGR